MYAVELLNDQSVCEKVMECPLTVLVSGDTLASVGLLKPQAKLRVGLEVLLVAISITQAVVVSINWTRFFEWWCGLLKEGQHDRRVDENDKACKAVTEVRKWRRCNQRG